MRALAAMAALAALAVAGVAALMAGSEPPPVAFSETERTAILAHGPWPQPFMRDPSNRVSGNPAALASAASCASSRSCSRLCKYSSVPVPRAPMQSRRRMGAKRFTRPNGNTSSRPMSNPQVEGTKANAQTSI